MVKKTQIVNRDNIEVPVGTIEDFKRPNHTDFMDSSELAKAKFNGQRHNSITNDWELWIDGEVVRSVTEMQVKLNPQAINEALESFFGLEDVQPDVAELKRFRKEN
jgi:hypothetical protein